MAANISVLNFLFALKAANLRTFKEFKFIHPRIATNTFLSETGIEDKEMCSFCKKNPETLLHRVFLGTAV